MSSSTGSYSGIIEVSLNGRTDNSPSANPDGENNASMNTANKKNSSGNPKETKPTHKKNTVSKRKSNAGRKKIDEAKKKKQLVLTLTPATYNALQEWAETKPRSAANYASDFIEEHLNDIIK